MVSLMFNHYYCTMQKKLMPSINVPSRIPRKKETVIPYIQRELERRVRETEHLPDTDKRNYRVNTTINFNNAVERIKKDGQFILSQLLPLLKKSFNSVKKDTVKEPPQKNITALKKHHHHHHTNSKLT